MDVAGPQQGNHAPHAFRPVRGRAHNFRLERCRSNRSTRAAAPYGAGAFRLDLVSRRAPTTAPHGWRLFADSMAQGRWTSVGRNEVPRARFVSRPFLCYPRLLTRITNNVFMLDRDIRRIIVGDVPPANHANPVFLTECLVENAQQVEKIRRVLARLNCSSEPAHMDLPG